MGQYYYPAMKQNGEITIYNRRVDGEYTMAKLMEHSWWENPFCKAMANKIYKNPAQLVWCGDYADEWECEDLNHQQIMDDEGVGVESVEFSLDDKFLVNHSDKTYIDLNKYKEASTDSDGWVINPLPLLTAQGNGRGGGDYYEDRPNYELVGCWTWDLISIEDEAPEGYLEFKVCFKEC